jgi:hypothetical protein
MSDESILTHKDAVKCPYCFAQCEGFEEFQDHLRADHGIEFICPTCYRYGDIISFDDIDEYFEHFKTHPAVIETHWRRNDAETWCDADIDDFIEDEIVPFDAVPTCEMCMNRFIRDGGPVGGQA